MCELGWHAAVIAQQTSMINSMPAISDEMHRQTHYMPQYQGSFIICDVGFLFTGIIFDCVMVISGYT